MAVSNTMTVTIKGDASSLVSACKESENSIKKVSNNTFSFSNIASTSSSIANKMASSFKTIAVAAVSGTIGLKSFIDTASDIQSLRASFVSLTGSVENANSVMETLYSYGKQTAFDNKAIQSAARNFLSVGMSIEDMTKWVKMAGDVAGATGGDLSNLSLAFSQIFSAGRLTGQDWLQLINNNAGGLRNYIIQASNGTITTENFKDAMAEGAITTELFTKALELATAEGGNMFAGAEKQAATFNGRMSNLQEAINNVGLAILGVNAQTGEVTEGGLFDVLSTKVLELTTWLEENQETITYWANVIIENFIPALSGLAAAWGGLKIIGVINALMTASPLTWIISGITALIAVLVALQVKFDWIGKSVEFLGNLFTDVFGALGNFFGGLWTSIVDGFSNAWNWITGVFSKMGAFFSGVWNTIAGIFTNIGVTIGEAVTGAFKSVVNGILGFIEGFVNTPIRILNGFISLINGAFGFIGVNLAKISTISLPRLEQGGIIPGNSYSGDRQLARVNSGEMVINRQQQAMLWDAISTGNYEAGNTVGDIYINVDATNQSNPEGIAVEIAKAMKRAFDNQGITPNLANAGSLR